MQVVEHVEEGILAPLSHEVLDIVDDEDVHPHVVRKEIREFVVDVDGIHVLGLELIPGNIENDEVGEFLLDGDTDGLGEMSLAKTRSAEDEQRIERSLARCGGA